MRAARIITGRLAAAAIAVIAALGASACGPTGNVSQLEFTDVVTGYHDEGVVNGENKIVPQISFRLKNAGPDPLGGVQLNVHFFADGSDGNMDEQMPRTGSDGIAAQQTTEPLTVRSKVGYTSQQSRADMMQNSQFRDIKIRVFAKSGSSQWSRIGDFTVDRTLLPF
jgi:hypothetical protein